MCSFNEAFGELSKNPTPKTLDSFASQIEEMSKIASRDEIKSTLLSFMARILKEPAFESVREDESMLRLYKIICRLSTQLGGIGIYGQIEKRGHFSRSLNFHLQWAEECGKVKKLEDFKAVVGKAIGRLGGTMSVASIESGFRDLAEKYFSGEVKDLFSISGDVGSKRRIPTAGSSIFGPKTRTMIRSEFVDSPNGYPMSIEEFRYAKWEKEEGSKEKRQRENRANPRRRRMSTVDEEQHEEEKRMRMFSPDVKTEDAHREPLRNGSFSSFRPLPEDHFDSEKENRHPDDEKPSYLSNGTSHFSVLSDPDPTLQMSSDRLKKTSNGLNVVYDDQEQSEDVATFDEDTIVEKTIRLTSTPAGCIPFVPVEEYFGNKENRNEEELRFAAPSTSSLHQMLRRKSLATSTPTTPAIASSIEKIDLEETTGIKNRRRSEVMRGDVNPWDEDLRRKVMSLVRPPTNMHELAARSPKIQAHRDFEAGGERFRIQELIGQGGYAKVYKAANEEGRTVAVKYEVPSCAWEVYICDQMRNRLLKDGDVARRRMADACIMQVIDAYIFSTASLLVNEYHEHGTLLEMANNYKDPNWHVTCFLLTQMARILKEVHACNIIHGDVKPDNFIITRRIDASWNPEQLMSPDAYVFKLIDWGRAIDMLPLPGSSSFKGRAGTEGFDSPEMIDGRSWTYQADFYGFAATMAVLVTGKYATLKGNCAGNYSLNVDIKRRNILRGTVLDVINKCVNIEDVLPDWNDVINAFLGFWNDNFEAHTWKQAAFKFNEACEISLKSRS